MNWREAELYLDENISLNHHLDKDGKYKIVTELPNDSKGYFKIKVGKSSFIKVSKEMLERVFVESCKRNKIYNGKILNDLYSVQYFNKPCLVHSIGKLFVHAGIAEQINNRNYRIL